MNLTSQKAVLGNWTMHTTAADAMRLAKAVAAGAGTTEGVSIALCPPFVYLAMIGLILKGSEVALGEQNLYPQSTGAFTVEVIVAMLLDVGCTQVILGHSERRRVPCESDMFVNQKVRFALAAGLRVILCVGETLDQRKSNQTGALLDRQLTAALEGVPASAANHLSIAYEPVWAIGNPKHHATPFRLRRRTQSIANASQSCTVQGWPKRLRFNTAAAEPRKTRPFSLAGPVSTGRSWAVQASTPTIFWRSSGRPKR